MGDRKFDKGDSHGSTGGSIPGAPGLAAFSLLGTEPSAIPLLLAVPHAGRAYPDSVLANMRSPKAAMLKLEDRYVDSLARDVAQETGSQLLIANAPRAMIDLNRATDDVDWEMFGPSGTDESVMEIGGGGHVPTQRARSGLGLIPRRVPGIGELWKQRHEREELAARIAGIHQPYHACLKQALQSLRRRWGAALLLDLHSMPPLPVRGGALAAQIVLGDRFGASCDGGLVASAFGYFGESMVRVAHNRPYAGGHVLACHALPARGLHAMQIEIDRSLYLDACFDQPGKGYADVVGLISGLVRRLAAEVAVLGRSGPATDWAAAAE